MRNSVLIGAALAFVAAGAMAQTPPPAGNGPQNSAVNTTASPARQATQPVKGHNSFTMGEARKRIEKQGFTNVTGLAKDKDGIWRGQAMQNGQQVAVALDYEGNVVTGTNAMGATGTPTGGNAGR